MNARSAAREHFDKRWSGGRFHVLAERRSRTWWGGKRVELDVDVGWKRAWLNMQMNARNGSLIAMRFTLKPEFGGSEISEDEALAIARDDAQLRGWDWEDSLRATRTGSSWSISRPPRPNMRTYPPTRFTIDATTGVVVDAYRFTRGAT